jgi:uncharacterized protein (TIGR00255 family)
VDQGVAAAYIDALRQLQSLGQIGGELTLDHLVAQRDLFILDEDQAEGSLEAAWEELAPALAEALDALDAMRLREGQALEAEITAHLAAVEGLLGALEADAPRQVSAQKERLQARLSDLLDGRPLDVGRLEQEVAILADRSDVTEEFARLRSHLGQFRALLAEGGNQGRRCDFLLQEMNRETNTIGSKAADAQTSHRVVALKAELEKIREQVQNVE